MLNSLLANLAALKRILFSARFDGQQFDGNYTMRAEKHARKDESRAEQQHITGWLTARAVKIERVLDVGCNTGIPLDFTCSMLHCAGVGVDINPTSIEKARQSLRAYDFLQYDGHTLPFENNSFGHAMLHHVIGHVQDPDAVIAEIVRVLRPGGTLSLITTNGWYQFWQTPANIYRHFRPDPTILRYYTSARLVRLLKRHGLEVEHVVPWSPGTAKSKNICRLRLMVLAKKCQEPSGASLGS